VAHYRLALHPAVVKEVTPLPPKQFKQVMAKILSLLRDPYPQDAKRLRGFKKIWRTDQGEYRIAYTIDESEALVTVLVIGRRNDDAVYRTLKRRFG